MEVGCAGAGEPRSQCPFTFFARLPVAKRFLESAVAVFRLAAVTSEALEGVAHSSVFRSVSRHRKEEWTYTTTESRPILSVFRSGIVTRSSYITRKGDDYEYQKRKVWS